MNSELYTDKPCIVCGKMMRKVGKAKKYCKECHKKIAAEQANRYYHRRKAINRVIIPNEHFGDDSQCKTCAFASKIGACIMCDYAEKVGHSRECEPSPDCTKYERKK